MPKNMGAVGAAFKRNIIVGDEKLSFEKREALIAVIVNLPLTHEAHAKVIVLHYLNQMKFSDIAERLHLSLTEVHQLHFEALQEMRNKLGPG